MQSSFSEIFQKRMDRKDFLKHVMIGFIMISGAAGIVKMLKPGFLPGTEQKVSYGYGAQAYGGTQFKR